MYSIIILLIFITNAMAIDQAGRDAVVYWHNYFRAELVAGRVKNKTGEFLPKAKDMMQMYFSLELEKQAQEWADKCTYSHSNPYGNYGENFYAYARMDNDSAAIEYVVKGWWSELIYRGALGPYPGQDCVAFDAPQNNRGIGHWTQLAWWNTNLVGCGIGRCPKYKSYVVCQYKPPGNVYTACVYRAGEPCTDCPNSCNATSKLCLDPKYVSTTTGTTKTLLNTSKAPITPTTKISVPTTGTIKTLLNTSKAPNTPTTKIIKLLTTSQKATTVKCKTDIPKSCDCCDSSSSDEDE
uniref:Venom allergen-like protein n=2 Tax=Meloidogyne incognita TaxID=6306 RepID=A7X975_MELIC|nr:venom allergen-like protein [Meloidogyne incognita]ABO38110.1 venom allergen-like protein [Meloidogyne incognita]